MFQNLSERLQGALAKLTKKGKLSEADIDEAMREVRLALLEADVNYKVVKDFVKRVKEKAIGQDVMESLSPGQMVVKIVNEELVTLMSSEDQKLNISSKPPTVIMMCGLQGAGKTTHAGKLSRMLKKDKNKRTLLVAGDVYRPAAIKQLNVVGESAGADVFSLGDKVSPVEIAKQGLNYGIKNSYDYVIIDTAGRLQIDEELMNELEDIKATVNPDEILLVVDAMTGQEAVNVAKTFNEKLDITGIVLSKLDGDARGGAALSIKAVTDKPIKFIGTGEKLDDLEEFYPDRVASRILGMGDILSLIEKAERAVDEKSARELEEKIRKQKYDLQDFYDNLQQMKSMGSLSEIAAMIPGVNQKALGAIDDSSMVKVEVIIQSMTQYERENPDVINSSRRKRIAEGSGTSIVDVNRLLKQFKQTKKLMKQVSNMQMKPKRGGFKFPFFR